MVMHVTGKKLFNFFPKSAERDFVEISTYGNARERIVQFFSQKCWAGLGKIVEMFYGNARDLEKWFTFSQVVSGTWENIEIFYGKAQDLEKNGSIISQVLSWT